MSENSVYFAIDLNSRLPRYYQIKQNIADLIQANLLRAGDTLPSERELSEQYGVNRMTVRQAISDLVNAGLLRRQHGKGTFIADKSAFHPLIPAVTGFSERALSAGLRPTSRVLSQEIIPASPVVAERLCIEHKAPVILLKRLRLVDNEPLMIEKSYLPHHAFPDLLDEDFNVQSLYTVLVKRYAAHIIETEQTLEPTLLTADESQYFNLKAGQPAMLVHVVAYTHQHRPVEFSKAIIRGDRCRYYFTVNTQSPVITR
jgi:GntR family transcriptional regulator